jgi:hypothetical protein
MSKRVALSSSKGPSLGSLKFFILYRPFIQVSSEFMMTFNIIMRHLRPDFTVTYQDTVFRKFSTSPKPYLPGDDLYGILLTLLDEDQVHMWKQTRLYDQLDSIITSSPEQRARISPQLSDILARRGVIVDLRGMIEGHRPRVQLESDEEMSIRMRRNFGSLWQGLVTKGGTTLDLEDVAFPTSRSRYPKVPRRAQIAFFNSCSKLTPQ